MSGPTPMVAGRVAASRSWIVEPPEPPAETTRPGEPCGALARFGAPCASAVLDPDATDAALARCSVCGAMTGRPSDQRCSLRRWPPFGHIRPGVLIGAEGRT